MPKSTLNVWFKDLPRPNHLCFIDQKAWLMEIRKLSAAANRKKRQDKMEKISQEARKEIAGWQFLTSAEMKKSILSMLYWAEGQKLPERGSPVKFANTDPRLVLLFLVLLRDCYRIDESKLRIQIHVHWYHNKRKVRRFWSKLLNVDESLFNKIYVKQRSKSKRFRKNFAGICFVIYNSVDLRREIVATGYNIAEKITGKIPVYLA
ncbi:hypothetical protein HYU89_01270 [Candidatus Collierbacteria bacterium]|nr:hypothetical protein [Candidatus Collierbacteria bacterium]